MKMKIKMNAFARATCLLACGVLWAAPLAAKTKVIDQGDYRWTLDIDEDKSAAIYGCMSLATGEQPTGALAVPERIGIYRVRSIGPSAFAACHNLTTITLPDGIRSIGENAFSGCITLTSINLPSSLKILGASAFENCWALSSLTLPSSVTNVGAAAFQGCTTLTSLSLPRELPMIPSNLCNACVSLTSINLPRRAQIIGAGAFSGCWSLTSVSIPTNIYTIGESAFAGCTSLVDLKLSDHVVIIRESAFQGCLALPSVTLPESLRYVESSAFAGCWALATVTLTTGQTRFGTDVFAGSAVTSVNISPSVTRIPENAFTGCTSLKSVTFPIAVTNIGASAFASCHSLSEIVLPDYLTSIDSAAFSDCKSLRAINIPRGVQTISADAFLLCTSLSSLALTNGLRNIASQAFYGCTNLTSLTLPATVTNIEESAFGFNNNLSAVIFECPPPTISGAQYTNGTETAVQPFGTRANGFYSSLVTAEWRDILGGNARGGWFSLSMYPLEDNPSAPDTDDEDDTVPDDEDDDDVNTALISIPRATDDLETLLSASAVTFHALAYNSDDETLAATLQLKLAKANKKTGDSKVTLTIQNSTSRKRTYRGTFSANGTLSIQGLTDAEWDVTLDADGLSGSYSDETGTYTIVGARDYLSSKAKAEKAAAKAALSLLKKQGALHIAALDEDGMGYHILTVTPTSSGKAKATLTLANGTKLSASSQLIFTQSEVLIPLSFYNKKLGLSLDFAISINNEDLSLSLSAVPYKYEIGFASNLEDAASFNFDVNLALSFAEILGAELDEDRLPEDVEINISRTKWTVDPENNAANLKLTYKAKDGTFKGSFKVYDLSSSRAKAITLSVRGVVIDGVGYGSAAYKKVCAVPVWIE